MRAGQEISVRGAEKMTVVKRSGVEVELSYGKIRSRLSKLCYGLRLTSADVDALCVRVLDHMRPSMKTTDIDCLAAQLAAMLSADNADYGVLASRVEVSNLHKETPKRFSEVVRELSHNKVVTPSFARLVEDHKDEYDSAIIHDRDFNFSYFDIRTLIDMHLLRLNGKVTERPQHLLMRVAVSSHQDDHEGALKSYHLMSKMSTFHLPPGSLDAGRSDRRNDD